jgi:hypothetical protein
MILGKTILLIVVVIVIAWMIGGFLRNYRR